MPARVTSAAIGVAPAVVAAPVVSGTAAVWPPPAVSLAAPREDLVTRPRRGRRFLDPRRAPGEAGPMRRHGIGLLLLAAWVLIEVPAGPLNDDDPAIENAVPVRTFDSQESCESFRTDAMSEDAEMGLNDGLDQDRQMRCVPQSKLKPKAKDAAPAAGDKTD
jgi:hypothetical protein